MNVLITALFALGTTICTVAFGQAKYIETNEGRIVDSIAYGKMKEAEVKKMKSLFPTKDVKVTITDNLKEIRRNKDSIIYSYNWDIKVGDAKNSEKEGKTFNPSEFMDKPFPMPALKTLDRNTIALDDLRGKPTLINFWFTTCKPCIEEMPVLNDIQLKLKDSVRFIAITFESNEKTRAFLKNHHFNFLHIPNAKKFIESLGLTSYPLNIFLDSNGMVRKITNGIPYIKSEDGKLRMGDGKEFADFLRELL